MAKPPQLDSILQPKLPKYENPIDKQIEDARKKLGLLPQPSFKKQRQAQPEEIPGLSATVLPRLDVDRNGFVSRDEYFAGRQRGPTAGARGQAEYLSRYRRFLSRFRTADSNRDGRLSPDEIDRMEGRRF